MREALTREIVVPRLRGRFGRDYLYVERCESTQRLLPADAPEGAVAVAEEQTEGRGRLGRHWHATPFTSLLISLNLRPEVAQARLPELTVMAAQAASAAIEEVAGVQTELKHPNDLLVNGRKLAGILAEAREGRVVLGIGINVNVATDELPAEVDTPATSLLAERGEPIDRAELLVALLEHLELHYERWLRAG